MNLCHNTFVTDSERNTAEFIFSDPKKPNKSIEVIDLETLKTIGIYEVPRSDSVNGKPAENTASPEVSPQSSIT